METYGKVKSIRKDKKGLMLDNEKWYSNQFLKSELTCNRGDEVKVITDAKGFLQSVEIQKKSSEVKLQIRDDVNASQLTSYAKDIVIAIINKQTYDKKEMKELVDNLDFTPIAKAVAEAYLKTKSVLNGEDFEEETPIPEKV